MPSPKQLMLQAAGTSWFHLGADILPSTLRVEATSSTCETFSCPALVATSSTPVRSKVTGAIEAFPVANALSMPMVTATQFLVP